MEKTGQKKNLREAPDFNLDDWLVWYCPIIMALFVSVTFSPILWNQFVGWDDYDNFINNPAYRGLGPDQLRWMFTTFHLGHYQPLSWVTFAIDYIVWGLNPIGYHLTNLIIHVANAVLFYFIARRLLITALAPLNTDASSQLTLSAALAALLFAIHPLRVESVAWATERRDVLSAFFFFATIYCYLRAAASFRLDSSRRWLYATLVVYGLSLLSKAIAMTLPIVLLLLDIYPLRRLQGSPMAWVKLQHRTIFWEKLPFVGLAVIFAVTALFAQKNTSALIPLEQYDIRARIGQAFYGAIFYLAKSIFPVNLSPLYELPYDPKPWVPVFFAAAILTLIVSGTLYFLRQRWPALLASWIYYLVILAPVLGFAQSGPQLVADRYTYLACLGFDLLIAGGIFLYRAGANASKQRRQWAPAAGLVVVLVLSFWTWKQTQIWRDTRTLWEHVITVTPDSSIAHYNLGRTLEAEGKVNRAMELYGRAVSLNPTNADAQYNLARLLSQSGRLEEAIAHYRQALAVKPNDAETHNNLGLLFAARGSTKEALAELQMAVQIDPDNARAYFNMGRIFAEEEQLDKAMANFEHALKRNPEEVEILLAAGTVLARQGNIDAATRHFRRAVALRPDFAEVRVALGRALKAQGKSEEAEKQYEEALRLMRSSISTGQSAINKNRSAW